MFFNTWNKCLIKIIELVRRFILEIFKKKCTLFDTENIHVTYDIRVSYLIGFYNEWCMEYYALSKTAPLNACKLQALVYGFLFWFCRLWQSKVTVPTLHIVKTNQKKPKPKRWEFLHGFFEIVRVSNISFPSLPLETFAICLRTFFSLTLLLLLLNGFGFGFVVPWVFSHNPDVYHHALHFLLYRNQVMKFNRVPDVHHDAFAFAPTETKPYNFIPGHWLYN